MFNQVLPGLLMAEHTARIERVNRNGWMRQASVPSERMGMRRHLGEVLVRFGKWLRAVPAGRAPDPVTA